MPRWPNGAMSEQEFKKRRSEKIRSRTREEKDVINAKNKAWRDANPDKVYARSKRKYWDDPEAARQSRIDSASRRREQISAKQRKYRAENIEYCRIMEHIRQEKLQTLVKKPRCGPYSKAEVSIIQRDDLTIKEICMMTQRSYAAISNKRVQLRKKGVIK